MDVTGPDPAGGFRPDQPDDRDLDDGGLDLTPRTSEAGRARGNGRRWGAMAVLVLLAGTIAFVVVQARGASLYYRNADEAVAQRDELGDTRFRLQGVVIGEPDRGEGNEPTRFAVAYNGVSVDVDHSGSEPALFKEGLPVIVEGSWHQTEDRFISDRLLVKHTEDYKAKDDGDYDEEHPDRRVEEAESS